MKFSNFRYFANFRHLEIGAEIVLEGSLKIYTLGNTEFEYTYCRSNEKLQMFWQFRKGRLRLDILIRKFRSVNLPFETASFRLAKNAEKVASTKVGYKKLQNTWNWKSLLNHKKTKNRSKTTINCDDFPDVPDHPIFEY